uniref:BHLH domain-containing protein n=1 Tax=Parascaris univalens TaxID=6257 RepID=A0A915CB77_PARUN
CACEHFTMHRRGQKGDQITDAIARRRTRSNRKERKRNEEMNQAYEQLQKCVPHIPNDQKLPKIKTLRLALRYIKHLQDVLKGSEMFRPSFSNEARPLELEDFASVAMAEVQARNNYKDRAEREAMRGVPTEQICRRGAEQFPPPQTNPYRACSTSTCCSGSLPSSNDVLPAVFLNSTNFTYSTVMQSTNPHYSY